MHTCSNVSYDSTWYAYNFHLRTQRLLQALITNALLAVLPPNSTFTAVRIIQQLNSDTVIVDAEFQLWESQLAVLLANKCCALEVLFLQQAVRKIDPTVTGKRYLWAKCGPLPCLHAQTIQFTKEAVACCDRWQRTVCQRPSRLLSMPTQQG